MRIISPYKDYYDCIQSQGQDQSFVYLRRTEEHDYGNSRNKWPFPKIHNNWYFSDRDLCVAEAIVGFCGKIYPVIGLSKNSREDRIHCYSIEDVDEFIKENRKKKQVDQYFEYGNKKPWRSSWRCARRKEFEKFFTECVEQQDIHEKLFVESGHPLFVAKYKNWGCTPKITFNAELKGLKFFRVFPTAIAFQEIAMYLGGVLGTGNPSIPEVSNNDLIEAKGFDLKYSFRKEKASK